MGPTWKKGLDLDRIDNNAGYNPENCRWTTRRQNALNRRKTVIIEKGGQRIPLSIAAEKTGISTSTLAYRLEHNWPVEYLFVKPDCRNKCTTSGIVVRGTDHDEKLIGQWKSNERTMTMLRDGRFAVDFEYIGVWETDSNHEQITITHYDPFKEDVRFSYRMSDSKLIIKSIDDNWGDKDEVFIRLKPR